jgi:hypothetical protein
MLEDIILRTLNCKDLLRFCAHQRSYTARPIPIRHMDIRVLIDVASVSRAKDCWRPKKGI